MIVSEARDRIDLTAIPAIIPNQIGSADVRASDGRTFAKVDPATGREICQVARSGAEDVQRAVAAAKRAQPGWAAMTVVKRGDILRQIAMLMREHREEIASLVARETGKSKKDAAGETDAAIEMGFFVAGEGRRVRRPFLFHSMTALRARLWSACVPGRVQTDGSLKIGCPVGAPCRSLRPHSTASLAGHARFPSGRSRTHLPG